jgi:LacI family transcriptional regulator
MPADTVRAYSRKGAAAAVRHLHAEGRRRIAFVNGPQHTAPGTSRRLGYLDGLRASGLDRDDALMEVADDFMIEPGRRATERLLARGRPDALLCANDLLAVGALSALREAGLDVPADVALVGMDNSSLSEVTWPPLTTVDLGSADRARIAAELLLERIEHRGREPRLVGVEPRLVVRASSGALR